MVGEMRLFRLVIVLVLATIVVLPVSMALAYNAYPTRTLPATVERGETFNVTVTFISAADDFHAASLTENAPPGWNVTVNRSWVQPLPSVYVANGNKADFGWTGNYTVNVTFTVVYKATVPSGASLGNYSFSGFVGYYVGYSGHIFEDVAGDLNVTVVPPTLCFEPASIDFYGAVNGTNPPNQTLELFSSTPCMLNWSLSDDAGWLEEYPTSGNCTNVHVPVALSANISGMSLGNYTANITITAPEANNSPQLVPVVLHIRTTGILKGQVNFIGRGDPGSDKWIEPFVVKLFEPGNLDNVLWTGNATTDNTGVFTIEDIVAATYDIGIKNWTSLSVLKTNVTLTAGVITPVAFGAIRQGDCKNDDDKVTLADRILMYNLWGTSDFRGDLKRDGSVGLPDRILMYSYWNQQGDLGFPI